MTAASSPAARWRRSMAMLVGGVVVLFVVAWTLGLGGSPRVPADLDGHAGVRAEPGPQDALSGRASGPGLKPAGGGSNLSDEVAPSAEHGPVTLVVDTPGSVRVLLGVLGGPRDGEVLPAVARERGYELPDMPYDGSVRLAVLSPRRPLAKPIVGVVTGPRLTLPPPGDPLICDVHAIDVATGSDVVGARLAADSDRALPMSVVATDLMSRRLALHAAPFAPPGWAVHPGAPADYTPALRASRLLLHLPMTREADVVVEAGPGGTQGLGELRILAAQVAGEIVSALATEVAGPDIVRLRGVPWLPEEPIRVLLGAGEPRPMRYEGEGDDESWEEVSPPAQVWSRDSWLGAPEPNHATDPERIAVGVARLGSERRDETRVVGSFKGASPTRRRFVEIDEDHEFEEDFPPAWAPGLGTVAVRVLDSSGQPLPFVHVECAGAKRLSDEHGTCRFERVASQLQPLALIEPGWTLTRTHVHVHADEVIQVDLREQAGGSLVFTVKDQRGRPLPAADIHVPAAASWADVDEAGIQRLDIRTDARGVRRLERFPAGTWQFRVTYGLRSARSEVTVTAGATTAVDIALQPFPDPAASADD